METFGRKILVVDDEPELLKMVMYNLGKEGYSAIGAESGEKAVEFAMRENLSLIILDMMLPGIDGIEVLETLKKNSVTRDIPVVFLTARNEMSCVVRGLKAGAVDYVTKPFNFGELLARINRHLELKIARDGLAASERFLVEANQTKDKFFKIITHELINPFAALCGISRFLVQNYNLFDDDKRLEMIHSILQASENGMTLLKNLLDWSKMQSDKMECRPDFVDICGIAEKNILLMKVRADYKGIQIVNDLDDKAPVYADPNMADMIIRNLMSNAVKFTPKDGQVKIHSRVSDDFREITVSDTGVGIGKGNLEKLFRIDAHHRSSGTDNEQGTGLGLILCKEFVERNGGTIGIESEPGKGTEVVFTLPVTLRVWEGAVGCSRSH